MKNFLVLAVLVSLVISCSPTSEQKSEPLTSGVYMENMDSTVRPGDNFQRFVNGLWMKNTKIPEDKSSYGIGYMVHERSQDAVKAIIEQSSNGEFENGSDEQKIGDLYASYMNMEARNELGAKPLETEFAKIDAINDKVGLSNYFAYSGKVGNQPPVGFFVYPNMKDPTQYAFYTWQGGLGLPDREYYFTEGEKSENIRSEYVSHISKMFDLAGLTGGASDAASIMDLETNIAELHWKKEDTRDMVALFNLYPVDSLDGLMPSFDWAAYMEEVGANQENIVITQPSYILGLNNLIEKTDLNVWKTYLKWVVLNGSAGNLNEALDKQNFAFYGTTLRGTPEQLPMWRRAVNNVNGNLGEMVGKVYVSKHFPPEAKDKMQSLVGNLIKAYDASINELDWMGTETRMQALDKLSKFTPKIGYPDKWKDYSDIEIVSDNLYNNSKSATLSAHSREMTKLQGPIDKTEWGMNPQTVNAYYNPAQNEIVFPAAILQPPFFDMTVDDAVNYGAIGSVIGHEIGHGFDDQGSTFDGDGVLRNWWTENDKEEFKKRTSALVEQYNEFKVFDDLNVNGEFTLGENIGDLGGLSIALKAYKMSLNGEEAPIIDGFTGEQRVFIGWAQAWLGKSREEALRVQVRTDPHSPRDFRVNGVVRNIAEFYTAFDVQEGDSLYLPPEQRVKIW